MTVSDISFNDIILNEKPHKNTLIYDVSYKTFIVIFDYWLYDEIYNTIRYLISKKSGIKNSIYHNFPRIRIDSYNSLPIQKVLTFPNVIILIKSVVNKNKNHYY